MEMTGAFVLHELERMRHAAEMGRVTCHLAQLRADKYLSVLLQLPSFAHIASEAFTACDRVRLVRLAGFNLRARRTRGRNYRRSLGRVLPRGRVRLRACVERPAWQPPFMYRMNPGTELAVLRVTDRVLLWPPASEPLGTAWRSL